MHVSHVEPRRSVRVSVPAGTSLDKIFVNKELIQRIRGPFGPGGCETCISGADVNLHQFEEVIVVELAE
jgi:hypothetical protein